jgi:hypothetical protein
VANEIRTTSVTDPRAARRAESARRWAEFRDGVASTTPQAIGRAALTVGVVGGSLWLAAATWPTLLPFLIGGLIAYMLLPVVDALDGVMPRGIAAGVSVLAVLAAVVAIGVIVVRHWCAHSPSSRSTFRPRQTSTRRSTEHVVSSPRCRTDPPTPSCRSWRPLPPRPATS